MRTDVTVQVVGELRSMRVCFSSTSFLKLCLKLHALVYSSIVTQSKLRS